MSIAGELARFVTSTTVTDLPPLALERARMAIASTIASAAMGADIASSRIIRELAREHGGAAQATLWFDGGRRLPVADAARVNAVMSDAAASDDSDLRSIAHIGTIVSTTSIAMAEQTGAAGRDVLAAMVHGYEIAGRIDEALTPGRNERGFHGSIATIFGGAVAAGTLLKLTQGQMTQAIALAATSIGGLMVAANTSVAREYHAGLSAMLGIQAALAAHKGLMAEENVLEMPRGFFSAYGGDHLEDVTKDLGQTWDIATNMAIKLVPGGHPHHAAAEAAANAAIAGQVDPTDVADIRLSSAKYRTLPGPRHPTDLIGVAHSPAYFIAAAVADRGYGWIHVSPEKVADPVIRQLIDKVTVDPNPPPYPDRFPHHHGATVTITLKDGRQFSAHVDFPRGSAPRGIEWADVDAKYRRLVPLSGLAPDKVEASLRVVHDFETVKTMSELTRLLS
ncbi:MAG TPA: MmgE/PrpD family protein [Chloroflexota bacterium]|nr:MmgE/PrpD family protein [Chloroflexota bacterium]